MAFPDEQILKRVMEGDEVAFKQLCTYFSSPAIKFCTVLLKDENDAKKIIENVFAMIWDDRWQLGREKNFQTYLFSTLQNQVFERLKKCNDQSFKTQYLERIHTFQK
jgi:RNA polymerase sigma-70 factor (ECF subfamily)